MDLAAWSPSNKDECGGLGIYAWGQSNRSEGLHYFGQGWSESKLPWHKFEGKIIELEHSFIE